MTRSPLPIRSGAFTIVNHRKVPFELERGRIFVLELWPRRAIVVDQIGTPVCTRWTPYDRRHLPELRFAQFGRTLVILHPELRPRALWCRGERDWPLQLIKPKL